LIRRKKQTTSYFAYQLNVLTYILVQGKRDERVEKEGTLKFRDSNNVIVNSQVSKNFLLAAILIYFYIFRCFLRVLRRKDGEKVIWSCVCIVDMVSVNNIILTLSFYVLF